MRDDLSGLQKMILAIKKKPSGNVTTRTSQMSNKSNMTTTTNNKMALK